MKPLISANRTVATSKFSAIVVFRVIAQAIDDHARHHIAQQCFRFGLGQARQAKGIKDDQEDDCHDRDGGIGIELIEEPAFLDIDRRLGRKQIPGSEMATER